MAFNKNDVFGFNFNLKSIISMDAVNTFRKYDIKQSSCATIKCVTFDDVPFYLNRINFIILVFIL